MSRKLLILWLPSPIANVTFFEDVFKYKIGKKSRKDGKNSRLRPGFTPRVKELLQQALEWRDLLDSGKVLDQAEIARYEGLSRARITQIKSLLRLAPEIQKYILAMPKIPGRPIVSERSLRPITQIKDSQKQVEAFEAIRRPE